VPREFAPEDREGRASAADQLSSMLVDRGIPHDLVEELVGGVARLRLPGEPTEVLADDLTLCSPRPRADEVRVSMRPLGTSDRERLTVVGTDRTGMLAATAGVVTACGLSVREAVFATWPGTRMALQAITLEDPECRAWSQGCWDRVGDHVRGVLSGVPPPVVVWRPRGPVRIRAERLDVAHTMVSVEARDRVGLLWAIASFFRDAGLNITAAAVADDGGRALDRFLADGFPDADALRRTLAHGHRGS
jgi:predicted amino acid-binding ACT domain protein